MISTTKRLLIQEFIDSSDETLKSNSVDDLHVETLQEFLQSPENDFEVFQMVMKKFYELYQINDPKLRLLLISFIPSLSSIYIRVVHNYYNSPRSDFDSLSILLLCLYNCEIMDRETGRPKTLDIRHVSLVKPSIYHEQSTNTGSNLPTEIAIKSIALDQPKIRLFGPFEEVEHLNASNYMSVLTVLMKIYNQNISVVGNHSLGALCRYAQRLLRQGTKIDIREKIHQYLFDEKTPKLSRNFVQIQFSSAYLVELTRAIHFCVFNDFYELGVEVLQEICTRATLNLNSDILLMVNAIKNSLAIKNSREHATELESALGNQTRSLQRNPRPITKRSTPDFYSIARKAAITTASFKTRKLPDDIPIVVEQNTSNSSNQAVPGKAMRSNPNKNLDSIHEEHHANAVQNGEHPKQLKKKESQEMVKTASATKAKVINMLKESKAKLSKVGGKENGKLSQQKNGHDSDASLNDSVTKLSLNDSFGTEPSEHSYPMTVFNRKRSKSIGRCVDEDNNHLPHHQHLQHHPNHPVNKHREENGAHKMPLRKDSSDGNSSDRSVSSSKSLLAKTRSFDSDKIAHFTTATTEVP